MNGPDPANPHPMTGFPQVCYIKNTVSNPNIIIGDGAIVASGSVVVSDVAPYTIVGGNPARPLKQRFPEEVVDTLLEMAWWS